MPTDESRAAVMFDRLLVALLLAWTATAVLPIAVWAGMVDSSYSEEPWQLWSSTLLLDVLLTVLALVVSRGAAARWLRASGSWILRLPRWPLLTILGALSASEAAAMSILCFARDPQSIDAWAQFFQARIFLSGHLVAAPPPSLAHFALLHMNAGKRGWFAQFPPIHAAMLAGGLALGRAWLVTPVLAGFLPVVVYLLGIRAGDERIALLAACLTLLSPFAIAMGASGMNHVPAALCVGLGLAATPGFSRGRVAASIVVGLAIGFLIGLRPLDGCVLALVATLVALIHARTLWSTPVALISLVLACATALLPTLVFNAATTGDPWTFTYSALWGKGLRLGFGHAVPWGSPLTPLRALGFTSIDAHEMDVYLLEWPIPASCLIVAGLVLRTGRFGIGMRLAAAYLILLVATLFFYFHRNPLYGPRFLFSAVPPLLVLLSGGLVSLFDSGSSLQWQGLTASDAMAILFAVTATVSFSQLAPRRLASYSQIGMGNALHPEIDAERAGLHHAVVLIPERWSTRLIARMWAAGVPLCESPRLFRIIDACTLEEQIAEATRLGLSNRAFVARLHRLARRTQPEEQVSTENSDPLIRLRVGGSLTERCAEELFRDRNLQMRLELGPFLYLNSPQLDGDVVWARELGADDAKLVRLFPGRRIYRYDVSAAGERRFVPVDPTRQGPSQTAER